MVIEDPRQHPGPPRILTLDTPEHLANQAALEFQVRAKAAMEESDRFAVALSGGATPRRMQGEMPPVEAADAYDAALRDFFKDVSGFDLLYLGLGEDGHTASLFPGSSTLAEQARLCVATQAPKTAVSADRLTLTYAAINAGRAVMFLVQGSDKADIVARVLTGPNDPTQLPAQGVHPNSGTLTWMLDAQAASKLQR